jgi:hypothetical protein
MHGNPAPVVVTRPGRILDRDARDESYGAVFRFLACGLFGRGRPVLMAFSCGAALTFR